MKNPADSKQVPASLYRQIPSVDELLGRPRLAELARQTGRTLLLETTRNVLEEIRTAIQRKPEAAEDAFEPGKIEEQIAAGVRRALEPSLRAVINATGVVLHTNLGRAPLAPAAVERFRQTATQYSNLEYDLDERARGKRDVHTVRLLTRLLGAEAAIVVNNCAAAVFLVLNTLAKGAEVIVSRGELIEIGDGFRIPEIMAESGATLREVGTTNRTRAADYEKAINERTRLLLRVHPSNFRVVGFTEQPTLEELVELGQRSGLPVCEDLGSGCLADLAPQGFEEPLAEASLSAGAALVTFSGDKLLGGPQAGIIAGKREYVERVRRNPMFRALRVDKLTIAALEATLNAYLRGALDEIPALRMIRISADEIGRRARAFVEKLRSELATGEVTLEIREGWSVIGGGATPQQQLATQVIMISSARHSAAQLETQLQAPSQAMPVVTRVEEDRLVLDLRTVFPEQEPALAAALCHALR
ncbi:MAG: L-seryl-tRNA(Sec) selenium transferase [Acidobacteria bacterium]|nr:L-seryl-tRNA(Sec) selenium transferase [Acidobacteriota bacterium]MBI3663079.1 L-seryl-tRNA(Sec) selenium transferase [Acidobacteriota bacterium]